MQCQLTAGWRLIVGRAALSVASRERRERERERERERPVACRRLLVAWRDEVQGHGTLRLCFAEAQCCCERHLCKAESASFAMDKAQLVDAA